MDSQKHTSQADVQFILLADQIRTMEHSIALAYKTNLKTLLITTIILPNNSTTYPILVIIKNSCSEVLPTKDRQ